MHSAFGNFNLADTPIIVPAYKKHLNDGIFI